MIKGAGDLATGVAQALQRAGMEILLTEIAQPLTVRRGAALSQAVFEKATQVEDLQGRLAEDLPTALRIIEDGKIPVLVDPDMRSRAGFRPHVLCEATLSKKNSGFSQDLAPITIALGPGFYAGHDAHVVVETKRGHDLARLIYRGEALPDTGEPGLIAGFSSERLLRATAEGQFNQVRRIGDLVQAGEIIAYCGTTPLIATIKGCLRGLLQQGLIVKPGMKVGDIDPRCTPDACFSISDKSRAIGGAVLVAIMQGLRKCK
ncbi:MAG: selenium-dependent molybdenum cofactor biosynthesis protein YqeB [Clostridiales bacterium]|nr:selenium-dependent molybdenum cofactor biosynthesis protein YqeB [Clostridiales bacterium]